MSAGTNDKKAFENWIAKGFLSSLFSFRAASVISVGFILLWLYLPSLDFYFFLDDFRTIDESRISSLPTLVESFSPTHYGAYYGGKAPFYRPFSTFMYFSAMKGIAGANPFYFRVVNLALFGIISLMTGKLIIDLSGDRLAAFFGATLYSANAAHALTQHWISCFPELISTFLVVVAFSTYVSWSRKGRAIYLAVSIGSFLLAMISKEIAVALPGLLLLFELLYVEPGKKKDIALVAKKILPFAIISLLFILFWLFFLGTRTGPYRISAGLFVLKNFALYLFSAVDGYLIGLLSVPSTDTLLRGHLAPVVAFWQTCLKFALVVLILAWLSWKQKWDIKREILFSLGWFIMGLGPLLFTPGRFQHYYLLF